MEAAKSQTKAPTAGESREHRDRALVAAILRKDRKATAEFVALQADAIYAYLLRRLEHFYN